MLYVATDFHGNYDIWKQIKEYLQEEDKLIYLGDAIDRGSRGFEIFMEMLDDPRVIFVKGNHEDMMYKAYNSSGYYGREHLKHWHRNGGRATQKNMNDLINKGVITFEKAMLYIQKIEDMPTYVQCPIEGTDTVVYLTHAGFTPGPALMQLSKYDQEYKLIWDRKHLGDEWPQEYKNIFIIHGHTPAQFMKTYAGTEVWSNDTGLSSYADGHKINLDLGVPSTGVAALYCINTMSVQEYFVAKADFQD